jgi:hypothetical protein
MKANKTSQETVPFFYLACPWHEGPLEESFNRTQKFASIFNEVAEQESTLHEMKS